MVRKPYKAEGATKERERHRHVVGSAVWKTLEDATRKLLSS